MPKLFDTDHPAIAKIRRGYRLALRNDENAVCARKRREYASDRDVLKFGQDSLRAPVTAIVNEVVGIPSGAVALFCAFVKRGQQPEETLDMCAKALTRFVEEEKHRREGEPEEIKAARRKQDALASSIECLEVSVRTYNILKGAYPNIVRQGEDGLLMIQRFGQKSLKEVKEGLAYMGLSLGMKFV